MRKIQLLITGLACMILVAGCKKDSGGGNNTTDTPSVIQTTTPATGSIYMNGSILQVRGNITDINSLSSAKLEVKNGSGTVLYTVTTPTGSVTYYNLVWDWAVTGIIGTVPATVVITATDYNSKVISKSINITLTD